MPEIPWPIDDAPSAVMTGDPVTFRVKPGGSLILIGDIS
jgi:hypothetical protein